MAFWRSLPFALICTVVGPELPTKYLSLFLSSPPQILGHTQNVCCLPFRPLSHRFTLSPICSPTLRVRLCFACCERKRREEGCGLEVGGWGLLFSQCKNVSACPCHITFDPQTLIFADLFFCTDERPTYSNKEKDCQNRHTNVT